MSLGPFHCEGIEILRRLFVTLRDHQWREVAPNSWNVSVDESGRTATIIARHTSPEVDFEWHGTLYVREDGKRLNFSFEGKAGQDMSLCRLGLVLLHPVESLVGSRVIVINPESQHSLTIAETIYPQPIVAGVPQAMTDPFSTLIIEREEFGKLTLRLAGDLFELEDQRNWGDASFKTYCTPLRLGFPRSVKAGTTVRHSVEIEFSPPTVRLPQIRKSSEAQPAKTSGRFPALGRQAALKREEGREATGEERTQGEEEGDVSWDHVHLDVREQQPPPELRAWLQWEPVERLQIGIDTGEVSPLPDIVALLKEQRHRILRLLVYGPGTALPSARAMRSWRKVIGTWSDVPRPPALAATRGYFVEFNRSVPLRAQATGIAFPLTATVHADDAATVAENVATIGEMAATAHQVTGYSELSIAPLALHYPTADTLQRFPRALVSTWLVATLIHAALARVRSVTLADDVLQALRTHEVQSGSCLSLAWLNQCAGLKVTGLPPLSTGVHAALVHSAKGGAIRILAANLTPHPAVITLEGAGIEHAAFTLKELTVPALGVRLAG